MRRLFTALLLSLAVAGCTTTKLTLPVYQPQHIPAALRTEAHRVTWRLGDHSTCQFDGTVLIEEGWLAHSDMTVAWVELHELAHCLTWRYGMALTDQRPWLTRLEVTANCVASLNTSSETYAQLPDVLRRYYPCNTADRATVARWMARNNLS